MSRVAVIFGVASLALAPVAVAHDPLGRAQPSIDARLVNTTTQHVLLLTIVDLDSRKPIPLLRVTASAKRKNAAAVRLRITKLTATRWRIPLASLRAGKWNVAVHVGGTLVAPQNFSIDFVRS